MHVHRRRLLVGAAAIPFLLATRRGLATWADAARTGFVALRPPARGTSATRCAMCGATDHTMLDPDCPAARSVV